MNSSYVTELNHARASERLHRARMVQVMRLAHIGHWKWDEDKGVPVEIDDQVCQIFGEPEEALAKDLMEGRILEKIHPGDHNKYFRAVEKYMLDVRQNGASARQLDVEYRILKPDGKICYVRSLSEPEFDNNGRFTHSLGYLQELTAFYRTKADQERVAEDLTRLVDTANAPIFGIDERGRVNEWNQQAEVLTGYGKLEVMGRDLVSEFITDEYKEPVGEVLEKALRGEETANYEFPLYTKAGHRLDVLLNSTTRRDTDGRIVGVVGVGQDITELRKSQAQVIQSSKLASLGEMATSVAHELNQPLNTIRMASSNINDALKLGKASLEYLHNKLKRIDDQVERASSIINHMRMFGREADEKYEQLEPRGIVKDTLGLIGEQLRLAGIDVVIDFNPACPTIRGHRIQMEQVLVNLIANARDAIMESDRRHAGRKIIIHGEPVGDHSLEISIADTGRGIPEKNLTRIFDPFFTTKEMGKGTGLGLSVSFGIIRDMGGNLRVDNIDDGAKFTITLPVMK
jgi:PAS domain S-box-containing protein